MRAAVRDNRIEIYLTHAEALLALLALAMLVALVSLAGLKVALVATGISAVASAAVVLIQQQDRVEDARAVASPRAPSITRPSSESADGRVNDP